MGGAILAREHAALCDGARHAAATTGVDCARDGHVRLRAADATGAEWNGVYCDRDRQFKNAEFILDKNPIEENCMCDACREFSRGYIRHLIKADEILGLRLITLHNLDFYLNLMNQACTEIERRNIRSVS
jgi:tRNA-guanine family transglycosylase